MQDDDPARLEVLSELRRRAIEVYGEERAAATRLNAMLEAAASNLWRVCQEGLDPTADEP